jgi:hypothetical protein
VTKEEANHQFTPGPWEADHRNYCISPEEDKANALLIAASPELYGALEAVAEAFLDNRLHEYSGNVMPLVWAALKKAGRQ